MKIGDPYIPQKLNDAVNAIITNYQDKGYLKAYVEPKVIENKDTSDVLIQMNIVEGNEVKVASIRFHGNTHFTDNELKRQMSTKENGFMTLGKFNEFTFDGDKDKIVKYYADRGYYRAKVDNVKFTYQWRNPEIKNEQDLIIDVYLTEGDKYYFGILISDSIVGKDFVVVDKEHSLKNLKGEILAFDFPLDTDYFKKGKSFAKYVKCEEGDLLENKSGKFYCNGEFIGGALPKDSKGNPVQDFKWNGIIPKDSFFV